MQTEGKKLSSHRHITRHLHNLWPVESHTFLMGSTGSNSDLRPGSLFTLSHSFPCRGTDGHGKVGGRGWRGTAEASACQIIKNEIGVWSFCVRVASTFIIKTPLVVSSWQGTLGILAVATVASGNHPTAKTKHHHESFTNTVMRAERQTTATMLTSGNRRTGHIISNRNLLARTNKKNSIRSKETSETLNRPRTVMFVPGECAFILCIAEADPAAPVVLLSPFLPQRSGNIAWWFVFSGQELVELGGGFRCDDKRPAVTDIIFVLRHPEDGIGLCVTTTTWTMKEDRSTSLKKKAGEKTKQKDKTRIWQRVGGVCTLVWLK